MKISNIKKNNDNIMGIENNIFFIGLTSLFTDISTKMVYGIMPLFLTSVLHTSVTNVSIIEGIAESTASVLKALSGWWSDKIGKNKPFMILGYFMTAFVTPLYGYASNWYQILGMRFSERLGKGIRTAPRDSLIAASGDTRKNGKNYGFHKAMDNSGSMIGPILAFIILKLTSNNYRILFLLAGIPAVFGLINVIFFVKEAKAEDRKPLGKIKFSDFNLSFYFFLGITFLFTLGNSTDALLLIKAQDIGFTVTFVPLLYSIYQISAVIFAVPVGILSDKIGREFIIIIGFFLFSIAYLGFGLNKSQVIMFILFAIYGLYSAATDGVQKALVVDIIDKEKRGTALGLYNSVLGITLLPASIIGGVLWNNVNHVMPFIFGAAMSLIALVMMVIYYLLRKSKILT